MTPSERFQVLLILIGVATTGSLTMAGVAVRDHYALKELVKDVRELVLHKESDHKDFKEKISQLERDQLEFYRKRRG